MSEQILHLTRPSGFAILCHLAVSVMSAVLCSGTVDNDHVDIYILGGQSNMAGRGGVENLANGTRAFDGKGPDTCGVTLYMLQGLLCVR